MRLVLRPIIRDNICINCRHKGALPKRSVGGHKCLLPFLCYSSDHIIYVHDNNKRVEKSVNYNDIELSIVDR